MAVSVTLNVGNTFPDGTTVAAKKLVDQPGVPPTLTGAASGSTQGSAGAISGGSVTITGLAADTEYVLTGTVSSVVRYLRFDTASPTGPVTQAQLAALDARVVALGG